MENIAGKFFNRNQLDSGRGDFTDVSVANFSDYDSNENLVGEGRSYQRGFGYKAKVALLGLVALTGLTNGCFGGGPIAEMLYDPLPRFMQPGSYRDAKEAEEREMELNRRNDYTKGQQALRNKENRISHTEELYRNNYLSEKEYKRIKLGIKIKHLKELGRITDKEYDLYIEALQNGELKDFE